MSSHLLCRSKHYLFTVITLFFFLLQGCEENYKPVYSNNVISGYISLDYYDESVPDNFLVTANGPYGNKSAGTDEKGYFEINGLGNGTYELDFSKDGYGTKHQYSIRLLTGDTVNTDVVMYKMIQMKMPRLIEVLDHTKNKAINEHSVVISTNTTYEEKYVQTNIRLFVSEEPDVSCLNYRGTFTTFGSTITGISYLYLYINFGPLDNYYEQQKYYPLTFESGEQLYIKAYVCNEYETGYYDSKIGNIVYSTADINECSDVLSYKIP